MNDSTPKFGGQTAQLVVQLFFILLKSLTESSTNILYNRHVSESGSAKRSQIGEIDQGQHNTAFIRGHEQVIQKKQYLGGFTTTVIVAQIRHCGQSAKVGENGL